MSVSVDNALPVEPQSVKKLALKSLKRSYDFFASCHAERPPPNPER
jgi:hypothetical protein